MTLDQRKALSLQIRQSFGWSQQKIADALGVGQQTISDWLNEPLENTSDTGIGIPCIPRADTKIPPLEYPAIWDRAQRGDKQAAIAAGNAVRSRRARFRWPAGLTVRL